MGLQGYVGNAEDVRRIRRQEKQRESEKKKFEDLRKASAANIDAAGLRQFGAGASEAIETVFKNETIGLVTREEFVSKRATVQERFEEEVLKRKRQAEEEARQERLRQREKKAKLAAKSKLSFGEDGEEDGADQATGDKSVQTAEASTSASQSNGASQAHSAKVATLGKNPAVPTDFLRDRDREILEEDMRRQLQKEYQLRQQVIKNEPLHITYSYWDGTGHRRKIAVRKGDTISQFLSQVRDQLAPEFREMRAMSSSSLMYIKEDLIIPQDVSFYDLIISRARGKSGPLFHFDVHDDIRVQHDATKEKDDSHAGKVVDRHWYNRNKHIFPANRWEMYEPT